MKSFFVSFLDRIDQQGSGIYLNQHDDERFRQSIRKIESNGGIASMLSKPARKEKLKIVETKCLESDSSKQR